MKKAAFATTLLLLLGLSTGAKALVICRADLVVGQPNRGNEEIVGFVVAGLYPPSTIDLSFTLENEKRFLTAVDGTADFSLCSTTPLNKANNPKFPFPSSASFRRQEKKTFFTLSVPITDTPDTYLCIAAHVEFVQKGRIKDAWGKGTQFNGESPAQYFECVID